MTIEFLAQYPSQYETKEKLSVFTSHEKGRIFLLTGNFSKYNFGQSATELEALVNWTLSGPDRELAILVGVFEKDGQLQIDEVATSLAKLVVATEKLISKKNSLHALHRLPISFYAVKKWHAKAIGLSGTGKRFLDAECAIFGSTNFSDSALAGENIELDLYMDKTSDKGKSILEQFILKVGVLIAHALKHYHVPAFHTLVEEKIRECGGKGKCLEPVAFN
jgi:hypothetical protein